MSNNDLPAHAGRSLQGVSYMDTSKIEFHFFLVAFVEMAILAVIFTTIRRRQKLPQKKFRLLISLEVLSFWLLGTLLLAIGLALWISTDL